MILLDNIIFALQKSAGGVSKAWAKHIQLLSTMRDDPCFLEHPAALENRFRCEVKIPKERLLPDSSVGLRHRLWPDFPTADLVHSSYYRVGPGKCPNVITVHDFIQELFPSSPRDRVLSFLKKRAIQKADAIITVSSHTKADMLCLYPWAEKKKITVIHNGVDEEYFPDDSVSSISLEGQELAKGSFYLYVGNRGYCKNFGACKTFLDHPYTRDNNLKLVVVGGGQFTKAEKQQFAENLELGQLLFLPFASPEQLNQLYNLAAALLFPSRYEGFGIPALEAARTGCIVLASDRSSVPEVVGPTPFMFDPFSTEEMNTALEKLDDKKCVIEESNRLRRYASSFGWQKNASETNSLYEELLR